MKIFMNVPVFISQYALTKAEKNGNI